MSKRVVSIRKFEPIEHRDEVLYLTGPKFSTCPVNFIGMKPGDKFEFKDCSCVFGKFMQDNKVTFYPEGYEEEMPSILYDLSTNQLYLRALPTPRWSERSELLEHMLDGKLIDYLKEKSREQLTYAQRYVRLADEYEDTTISITSEYTSSAIEYLNAANELDNWIIELEKKKNGQESV